MSTSHDNGPQAVNRGPGRRRMTGGMVAAIIGAVATIAATVIGIMFATNGVPTTGSTTSVPEQLVGRWSGTVSGQGASFEERLSLGSGNLGQTVASAQIEAYGCTANGVLLTGGDGMSLNFTSVSNPYFQCSPRAEVRITAISDDSLRYEVVQACDFNDVCSPVNVSGVLYRVP